MIVITFLCFLAIYTSLAPLKRLVEENKFVSQQHDLLNEELVRANDKYDLLQEDKYLAQQARSQYRISESGEILFKFPTVEQTDE